MATKNKSIEDRFFPVTTIPKLNQPQKPSESRAAIKKIIQGAIQGAFKIPKPDDYAIKYGTQPLVTKEQVEFVTYLIESLQPSDAIEAALASQFAIAYVRGLKQSSDTCVATELFSFTHLVLEALQKYRSKGAQQISVQYNVNQGQVVNIKTREKGDRPITLKGTGT